MGSAEEEALECCVGFGEMKRRGWERAFLGRGEVIIKNGGAQYQVI